MMIAFFFFQAEDGIRDLTVTGVQTCALPIYAAAVQRVQELTEAVVHRSQHIFAGHDRVLEHEFPRVGGAPAQLVLLLGRRDAGTLRERRVETDPEASRLLEVTRVLGDDERGA